MLKPFSILVLISLLAISCSTTNPTTSLNYPLNSIFAAVEHEMTMGIQKYSENHREFYSKPFVVIQSDQAKKIKAHERGRAKVSVLGDRRPYNVEVEVVIERAATSKNQNAEIYKPVRTDKNLAQDLLRNITGQLERRQQDKNVIDDFRSF